MRPKKVKDKAERHIEPFYREFDPGSGRTLAACLTHASRAEPIDGTLRGEDEEA